MDSIYDKQQKLIALAIASGATVADDGAGEAWIHPWQTLCSHLIPLIGDSGVAALLRRSLRIVATEYDWMGSAQGAYTDELLGALRIHFVAVDPGMAGSANAALLTTFTKLLSVLIGGALTIRILDSAWDATRRNTNVREQS